MKYIVFAFVMALSVASFVIAYFQYKERGFLFNNAYIYASKEEKLSMNKKPHYRQSAITFLMVGFLLFMSGLQVVIVIPYIGVLIGLLTIVLVIYAIVSSIRIYKNERSK